MRSCDNCWIVYNRIDAIKYNNKSDSTTCHIINVVCKYSDERFAEVRWKCVLMIFWMEKKREIYRVTYIKKDYVSKTNVNLNTLAWVVAVSVCNESIKVFAHESYNSTENRKDIVVVVIANLKTHTHTCANLTMTLTPCDCLTGFPSR